MEIETVFKKHFLTQKAYIFTKLSFHESVVDYEPTVVDIQFGNEFIMNSSGNITTDFTGNKCEVHVIRFEGFSTISWWCI